MDLSVLDTPRAATEINAAQMRDQSIVGVTDFVKIVSSAYTIARALGGKRSFRGRRSRSAGQTKALASPHLA